MDTSGRVLVATSNNECRAFLSDILGAWHLQSTECSTIAEARRAISDSPVSLVFCDTRLPDGDFTALVSVSSRQAPPKVVVLLREDEDYASAIAAVIKTTWNAFNDISMDDGIERRIAMRPQHQAH